MLSHGPIRYTYLYTYLYKHGYTNPCNKSPGAVAGGITAFLSYKWEIQTASPLRCATLLSTIFAFYAVREKSKQVV